MIASLDLFVIFSLNSIFEILECLAMKEQCRKLLFRLQAAIMKLRVYMRQISL